MAGKVRRRLAGRSRVSATPQNKRRDYGAAEAHPAYLSKFYCSIETKDPKNGV